MDLYEVVEKFNVSFNRIFPKIFKNVQEVSNLVHFNSLQRVTNL